MIYVGDYPLVLGVERDSAPDWSFPVLDAGRDAAYVDSGYLRALLDEGDALHERVEEHWSTTDAVFYTSSLVASEVVRQLAKASRPEIDQQWRWARIAAVKVMLVDERRLVLCSPAREVIADGLRALDEMQRSLARLDLCDSVSMLILDRMQHPSVCGFDNHFRAVGAALEPES